MKIQDYVLTVQLECDCGQSFILVGQVGQERECGQCPRFVRLDGFSWDDEKNQIVLKLAWGPEMATEPTTVPASITDFLPITPGTLGAMLDPDDSVLDVE